jgi:UDP-GlcNAc3NAcA epimerase
MVTGDVARDVLTRHLPLAPARQDPAPFVLATAHRAALTSDRVALDALLEGLGAIGLPVRLPLHPRTRAALERFELLPCIPATVRLEAPLGYLEMLGAVRDAAVVVTDSGGIQREAYWLGTPCITIRGETEWEETVACGANTLLPATRCRDQLAGLVAQRQGRGRSEPWGREAYGDGGAASRVADAMRGFLD